MKSIELPQNDIEVLVLDSNNQVLENAKIKVKPVNPVMRRSLVGKKRGSKSRKKNLFFDSGIEKAGKARKTEKADEPQTNWYLVSVESEGKEVQERMVFVGKRGKVGRKGRSLVFQMIDKGQRYRFSGWDLCPVPNVQDKFGIQVRAGESIKEVLGDFKKIKKNSINGVPNGRRRSRILYL